MVLSAIEKGKKGDKTIFAFTHR